ncbi:MAG: hypothetical protein ACYTF6_00050 [Planctomycetota bacterium]|jgi:hypothetical protein
MMARYGRIESVTFGQTSLPLPLSVRVERRAGTIPAAGQNDAFATSIQLDTPTIAAEVRIRGTDVAESISLGQRDTLSFEIAPSQSGQDGRRITLTDAVLAAVELAYDQSSMAVATMRFVAEAVDGTVDPFAAEDSQ